MISKLSVTFLLWTPFCHPCKVSIYNQKYTKYLANRENRKQDWPQSLNSLLGARLWRSVVYNDYGLQPQNLTPFQMSLRNGNSVNFSHLKVYLLHLSMGRLSWWCGWWRVRGVDGSMWFWVWNAWRMGCLTAQVAGWWLREERSQRGVTNSL